MHRGGKGAGGGKWGQPSKWKGGSGASGVESKRFGGEDRGLRYKKFEKSDVGKKPRWDTEDANTDKPSNGNDDDDVGSRFSDKLSLESLEELTRRDDELDVRFGFDRFIEGQPRKGWMFNMRPTLVADPETGVPRSALDCFFLGEDGSTFKASLPYQPYFYLGIKVGHFGEVEGYLRRKYEAKIFKIEAIEKEDLDLKNHLSGLRRTYLKLSFLTVQALMSVKSELTPLMKRNKDKMTLSDVYNPTDDAGPSHAKQAPGQALDYIIDMREYDVPYYTRVSIDNEIRCGGWYLLTPKDGTCEFQFLKDMLVWPDPKIFAFDIETTKLPLKFPDPKIDSIMMVSYMLDGQGYLIVNRQIVSQDIEDFEYTPKPEFEGQFQIHNAPDELALLNRFIQHIQQVKPNVYVTFNGDFFDWPFVEARMAHHGINMFHEIGVRCENEEYRYRCGAHLDAFCWVKRDSYLPQGSQGLKAVTTAKLGYNPMELDPEDMFRFASEQPQTLAAYSVSDAVATYYLYMKYVHPFIFSLCSIIPMNPEDVLRKGSGTLCEALLMQEAFLGNIIFPNKNTPDANGKFWKGHLLESETYVGGHVEALESGVFRSDLHSKFKLDAKVVQKLIDDVDRVLHFGLTVEAKLDPANIVNYQEVRSEIVAKLEHLRDVPMRKENPVIYHLDVMAMYPNIILTYRLQPPAIVDQETCAACDFNKEENKCQLLLSWTWRGDYVPANRSEYESIRSQLEHERITTKAPVTKNKFGFAESAQTQFHSEVKARLKAYSKTVYKVTHKVQEETREATVCQRENPFYVDTVKAFRDRRYIYKEKLKHAQRNLEKVRKEATSDASIQEAAKLVVLYDSLQLAHKCILNSFYGYVMRKGSRWFSMEMAGCVTYTGAQIIMQARQLVEAVGRPLELDTDGIWCILPASFPQNFKFKTADPTKSWTMSYPCSVLNRDVHESFTNHQYQTLIDPDTKEYAVHNECSIFFEVDGPYRAMILPASKEKDKKLKKRYAVFNNNGTLAELKGFEIKRRGELKLIKAFQGQIFETFLQGTTLVECYAAAAGIANQWLDVLDTRGASFESIDELLELLTESSNMSRKLEEYGKAKSSAITTAKRLAELLGQDMIKDKGLNCSYVVSKKPPGAPVTERVIPTAIFSTPLAEQLHFLRKWCKDPGMTEVEVRDILDWAYYRERLGSCIQKIITIPAALQRVDNPVPRIQNPDWMIKEVRETLNMQQQGRLMFEPTTREAAIEDLENIGKKMERSLGPRATVHKRSRDLADIEDANDENGTDNNAADSDSNAMQPEPDEFQVWLTGMKKKWKQQRENRKKRRAMFGANGVRTADPRAGNYFQQRSTNLMASTWEVLQVAETATPGEFVLWALIDDSSLLPVKLDIPRTFYINTNVGPADTAAQHGKRVQAHLPRSKPARFLTEYSYVETVYRKRSRDLAALFNRPEVEGVYETQVPLLQRALETLGNVCAVLPAVRKEGPKERFSLLDLEGKESKKYLDQSSLKYFDSAAST
eukprot:TRINITY_DN3613_c0_g1_i2.p1 TRINITY_DN3613_c0_g1~~TRINITY_DN3613_c0_g1_i2.p1  ORF type:complete len:1510 (-),score=589.87 TRINITY_DN3613_c0_g1_i2:2531-7060(-)